jgi:hypothetical protein
VYAVRFVCPNVVTQEEIMMRQLKIIVEKHPDGITREEFLEAYGKTLDKMLCLKKI